MLLNPSRILFRFTLMIGAFITISSNSWIGAWVGLEINLLSFFPLTTQNTQFSTEAALKYFLIQALVFVLLLYFILIYFTLYSFYMLHNPLILQIFLSSSLFMKMSAAAFHFWFPGVMEGLSWESYMMIMTWQKIGPLMLLCYVILIN